MVTSVAIGAGLGAWFPINSVAGRVMAGSVLVPLLLLGINIATDIPLSYITLLVYGVSLVGLIKFFRSVQVGEMLRVLINPIFVLPLIFLIFLSTINHIGYQSFEWDEFASWLYWSKELYLADGLNAGELAWQQLGYPQAWPIALALPQLLFGQFEPMRSLAVGVVWHAAVLGIAYEIIVVYMQRNRWASPGIITLTGYSIIFLLLAAEALRKLVPQDFLIELPQIFLLSSVFGLFCLTGLGAEKLRGLSFTAGVLLAAGMMVKVSVIAAVPAATVIVIYLSLAQSSGASSGGRYSNLALNLVLFSIPVALVQVVWAAYAGEFQSGLSTLSISFDYSEDHVALLARLGEAAWAYIGSWKMPLTLMSGIGLAYAAGEKEFRPIVIGLLVYFVFYSAGLFQLYAIRFGPVEVAELQSHQRYLRVPLRIMHILGVIFLLILVVTGSIFEFKHYLSARGFVSVAVLAVILVGGYQLYVVRQSLMDVRDRYSLSQERLGVIKELQSDRKALEPFLTNFGNSKPLIALIAQGDDGYSLRVVRFLALSNRKGEDRIKYRVLNGFTWSEHSGDKKRQPITALKLTEILRAADIIWGHRRDAWIDGIFKNFTVGCQKNISWRFLVKQRANNKYICIP
ncbi:MAG: hypothetical protein HN578_17640 [Rhodospirillales bacterium]|nr:hypothetical protein [Rhodospirillales bacterium]